MADDELTAVISGIYGLIGEASWLFGSRLLCWQGSGCENGHDRE